MKILLLKPISDMYYVIQPNLGLGYLATIMIENGHKVRILNAGREKLNWDQFTELIKQEKYDLVGIQIYSHEVMAAKRHSDIIKRYSMATTVIAGGAHISGDPPGIMHYLNNLDFGFVGEAEIGVSKFLALRKEDYVNHALLKDIPNLVWRQNGKIIVNSKQSFNDLDKIKFPAWNLMPPQSYPIAPHGTFSKKNCVAPIIISRGCPFDCPFCGGHLVTGKT